MTSNFYTLRCFDKTGSTNDDAKAAAEKGEREGLVIQALQQTSGKGRHGRQWESPTGNVYLSVLLRPLCSPQEASLYSFVMSLAVYDTARYFLPHSMIELKWPNDVLVEGKKISGILLEAAPSLHDEVAWLVLGVGINVASYPENTPYPVTSLSAQGAENIELSDVREIYLEKLSQWRLTLMNDGFDSLRDVWMQRARQGQITARMKHEEVTGQFAGLDLLGRLILKLDDGSQRPISAADIFFG